MPRSLLALVLALVAPWLAACDPEPDEPVRGVINVALGADVPSFLPLHVTGPHAGTVACPLCVYAHRPAAAIWTNPAGLPRALRLVKSLDDALESFHPRPAVGYVVLLPSPTTPRDEAAAALSHAFAQAPLRHVFLTVADQRANPEDLVKYHPAAHGDHPAVSAVFYVNRTAAHLLHATDDPSLDPDFSRLLEPLFDQSQPHAPVSVAMCADTEPGEPLEVEGRILDEHGLPLRMASIIAYSTDASGLYVPRGSPSRTPRLNAVAVTAPDGWYRFRTIRPGGYPGSDDPAHIHFHIDAAVHAHTYRTIWFEDDPRLTPAKRRSLDAETVIVPVERRPNGAWRVRLDVRLEGS